MTTATEVRRKAEQALEKVEAQRKELRRALGISSTDPRRRAAIARAHQRDKLVETQDVRYAYAGGSGVSDGPTFGEHLEAGPADAARREACRWDLLQFCKTYGGPAFSLPWSNQHHAVAELIQESVTSGDMTAFAMPRGSGKSTLSRWGVKWSIFYRHSHYTTLIGASERSAVNQLKAIKTVLRSNELLWADFPDVLACVRHIEGQPRRCEGQKFDGEPTYIEWTQNAVVVPIIANGALEWSVIDVTGVTGEVRGRFRQLGSGSILRPDMAIVDDPQTRKSAKSQTMVQERVDILAGDIKFMAGPDKPLGIVMPCTVIEPDDVADQLLDRGKHPEWHGSRTKFFERMPEDLSWWLDEYAPLMQELERSDQSLDEATKLYAENREKADAGFEPSWPERFHADYGEISAVQHGMNAYIRGKAYFLAEYQNEPERGSEEDAALPDPDFVAGKQGKYKRGTVPPDVSTLTAFVDVSESVLWWMVCGFTPRFDVYVVDYGTYPDQKRRYVTLGDIKRTLQSEGPAGVGVGGAIRWGLDKLIGQLMKRTFQQPDGTEMRIQRAAVDSRWGEHQTLVFDFCNQSEFSRQLLPSHGHGTKAPTYSKPQPGEIRGDNWRIAKTSKERQRVLFVHANYWKDFAVGRMATHVGDRGCLQLFGDGTEDHRMLVDQLCKSEVRTRASIGEYEYWQYQLPPHKPDNHFLDCLSVCCVLASVEGVSLVGEGKPAERQKLKLSEIQKNRRRA